MRLSIAKLMGEWALDIFASDIWETDGPISQEEVAEALEQDRLAPEPFDPVDWTQPREYHVERIAYLVRHGWEDPIEMDLGIPTLQYVPLWPIEDGHHRFAAALYRGDDTILVDAAGETDWIESFKPDG